MECDNQDAHHTKLLTTDSQVYTTQVSLVICTGNNWKKKSWLDNESSTESSFSALRAMDEGNGVLAIDKGTGGTMSSK